MSILFATLRHTRVVFDVSDAMHTIAAIEPPKGWIDDLAEKIKDLGLFEEVRLEGHLNYVELVVGDYDAAHVQECRSALDGALLTFYSKQLRKRKP